MKAFLNREDAAIQLAQRLKSFRGPKGVVLGIPRGGVPMAALVAKALNWPVDILLIKKIGHPINHEYAIGAVGMQDAYIVPHEDVGQEYIIEEIDRIRKRLHEMQSIYLKGRPPLTLKDKTVIIVDDGIATGNTLLMGIQIIKKYKPDKIIVAVPVASSKAIEKLKQACDAIICLHTPESFSGVGAFYDDFSEVDDSMVKKSIEDFQTNS